MTASGKSPPGRVAKNVVGCSVSSSLKCERVRDESVVTSLYAETPLRLLYLRPQATVYQSSLGGGLVDGDAIGLEVSVGAGARFTLKTQASTKAFRGSTRQSLEVRLEAESHFVSWPDPLVCFRDANYAQTIRIVAPKGASFIALDWLSSGRTAYGERWAFSRYESRVQLLRDETARVDERVLLDARDGDIGERMVGFEALGVVWSSSALRFARPPPDVIVAQSPLAEDLFALRFAARTLPSAARFVDSLAACI